MGAGPRIEQNRRNDEVETETGGGQRVELLEVGEQPLFEHGGR